MEVSRGGNHAIYAIDCRRRVRRNFHSKACHIMNGINTNDDDEQVPQRGCVEITMFNCLNRSTLFPFGAPLLYEGASNPQLFLHLRSDVFRCK